MANCSHCGAPVGGGGSGWRPAAGAHAAALGAADATAAALLAFAGTTLGMVGGMLAGMWAVTRRVRDGG